MTIAWTDFFEQLKKGDIARVYLFTGPEALVKEQALRGLREALLPPGMEAMNETVLEGAVSARAVIEAAETLPFLCQRRLVVVRDWPPLMPGKAKNETEDAEALIDWLARAPESAAVVFYQRGAFDARKKVSATLQKTGRAVAFDYLAEEKLMAWLKARAVKAGAAIDPGASEHLVFLAGRDLTRLQGEMDKLTAYAGAGKAVTRQMVEELVPPSLEATVFQMIDCLMERKMARAMELTRSMLQSGETRIGILAMLTRQMRMLTHIKLLKAEGLQMPAIEKQLSLNHYAATRMEKAATRFSACALEEAYRACVEADFAIKRGKARDEDALDQIMFMLGAL